MGLFDKFKNKNEEIKQEPQEQPVENAIPELPELTDEEIAIFKEKFLGTQKANQEEVNAICNIHVAKGILAFANGNVDENAVNNLDYENLCHVYNNIETYTDKLAPFLKKDAVEYKKYLRKVILKKLSEMTLYTAHAKPSNLPFILPDGSMLLYTNKEITEESINQSVYKWLELQEIEPEMFNSFFCEYYCTGYQTIIINGNTKVDIKDLYNVQDEKAYGNICKTACHKIAEFKQIQAMIVDKAKAEDRKLTEDEVKTINIRSWQASVELLSCKLVLPAQLNNDEPNKITVPLAVMNNGAKFVAFFTDQGAINRYFKKATPCVAVDNLIKTQYPALKKDENISGIVINPGRECYIMTKEMLSQLLRDHE